MAEGVITMPENGSQIGNRSNLQADLIPAVRVAGQNPPRQAANGVRFGALADIGIEPADLDRLVQAIPASIASALAGKAYYFVPLVMAEARGISEDRTDAPQHHTPDEAMVSPVSTPELADLAICHRNVDLPPTPANPVTEAVFISSRLLADRFALAFELFINVGHAFVATAGVPASFSQLAWNQVLSGIRGETSQDAWETRNLAFAPAPDRGPKPRIDRKLRNEKAPNDKALAEIAPEKAAPDEKAKLEYTEAAFSDTIAIYLLSLAVDFDYSELREREYPLLAPQALAERLRHANQLFPPNTGYEFAIRYRRRI